MAEQGGDNIAQVNNPEGAGERSGRLFAREKVQGLLAKREEAFGQADHEERRKLMQGADTERTGLIATLTQPQQDQLNGRMREEEEEFVRGEAVKIAADWSTEPKSGAIPRWPETTAEADPENLAMLQAQLGDLQLRSMYADPEQGGLILNRDEFNTAAGELLTKYRYKVGQDKTVALIKGLNTRWKASD
jgi:hypothetical protein